MDLQALVAEELEGARRRSLELLAPLSDADVVRQHSPIMSPLVWDLAHVGNYEELWLLRAVGHEPPIAAGLDDMYDAFRHPRPNRPALPLLGPAEARRYIAEVRGRVLDGLDGLDFDVDDDPLLAGAFVHGMVVQHEHQHDETMLATLQFMDGQGYRPIAPPPPDGTAPRAAEVWVPPGEFVMGTDDDPWAYDNERPAHVVDLPGFWIDAVPLTNGQYTAFIDDGGYADRRWWTAEGWKWRTDAGAEAPQFWLGDGSRIRFGWREPVPADEPVQHVCWYEADAYARWAGRRLPSEAEWEKAASWNAGVAAGVGAKRRYPWGDEEGDARRANLGQRHYRPAPAGAYPAGATPAGCQQLLGDVWEWTASDFEAYPGFRSFPYREYSEVFFGSGYKVLRGGSWATHPTVARTTFRNWDHAIRRQIFAGFRTARDAE